jgi:hypothetical protein
MLHQRYPTCGPPKCYVSLPHFKILFIFYAHSKLTQQFKRLCVPLILTFTFAARQLSHKTVVVFFQRTLYTLCTLLYSRLYYKIMHYNFNEYVKNLKNAIKFIQNYLDFLQKVKHFLIFSLVIILFALGLCRVIHTFLFYCSEFKRDWFKQLSTDLEIYK